MYQIRHVDSGELRARRAPIVIRFYRPLGQSGLGLSVLVGYRSWWVSGPGAHPALEREKRAGPGLRRTGRHYKERSMTAGGARAPFAADPANSRGRLCSEPPSATRNDFRRDCDRIIHSAAFRRLAHKTQVFVYHEGDHYRSRLTHTLEVAQIARSLARALRLDEDLAEGCALGHDLGHPPFGHSGERALDKCLAGHGGFDHNAQTLAVVTRLERRYAAFDGLNLTAETLEGLVKHNGPLIDAAGNATGRHAARGVAAAIRDHNAHDIDDGLRARMFAIDELKAVPLIGDILAEIDKLSPGLEPARRTHELVRRLITRMIEDVIGHSKNLIAARAPGSVDDIRRAGAPVVAFSADMAEADRAIKAFLFPRMYRHARIMRIMGDAQAVVADLFARYMRSPGELPWRNKPAAAPAPREVADFIAGMTDRYALSEHSRLFDSTPELR
jgi:dGTPase